MYFRPFITNLKRLLVNCNRKLSNKTVNEPKKVILGEPEFDYEYLTNPGNREEIEDNVKKRQANGNIDVLLKLNDELLKETNSSKREKLLQALIVEAHNIPNQHHPDLKAYGNDPKVIKSADKIELPFGAKTYKELCGNLKVLRTSNLNAFTGERSYYLMGDLAELEQALIKYTLSKLCSKNFRLLSVPDILPAEILERCGMNTQGKVPQVYFLDDSHGKGICLSGTSEMALASYYCNTTLNLDRLPISMTAVSRCYRYEISNHAYERGIYRVHQFTKVEMFGITKPNDSEQLLERFLDLQIELFKPLGLDFRVLDMPVHELGPSAYRKFDVEAWFPGQKIFGEISSCSNCTSYQSRRLNIKYKDGDHVQHVHTVNGTACAITRMIISLLETHQLENGNIRIPKPLRRFLNDRDEIKVQEGIPMMRLKKKEARNQVI